MIIYRNQELSFNHHASATAKAGAVTDHGPAKGLIHNMIFRKDGKPTSHLFDVRDAIASNPPAVTGAADRSSNWVGSSSARPLSRVTSAAVASTGFALGNHHLLSRWRGTAGRNGYNPNGDANTSSDPVVPSEVLGARLEVRAVIYATDTFIISNYSFGLDVLRLCCGHGFAEAP
jgi:hypothetical protein